MHFKTLQLGSNLREQVSYSSHTIPLSICIDSFDDYFRQEWSCHWHDELEFAVVQKGCVEYTIYDGQSKIGAKTLFQGDGIFINAGVMHSAKGLEPGTMLMGVVFPITFFDRKPFQNIHNQNIDPIIQSGVTNLLLLKNDKNDIPLLNAISELCHISEQEIGFELHCIEMVCKMWRLLATKIFLGAGTEHILPSTCVQEQRLRAAVSYIHTHYNERVTIDDIAKNIGISRTECFRCFHSILGKSPIEYLIEYRLSIAAMLLGNTDRTLTDISISCGFNSPSYFGKLFREQSGMSPRKFREQLQKI